MLTHTPPRWISKEAELVIAEHDMFGCDDVGFDCHSFGDDKDESCDRFVKLYRPAVARL